MAEADLAFFGAAFFGAGALRAGDLVAGDLRVAGGELRAGDGERERLRRVETIEEQERSGEEQREERSRGVIAARSRESERAVEPCTPRVSLVGSTVGGVAPSCFVPVARA